MIADFRIKRIVSMLSRYSFPFVHSKVIQHLNLLKTIWSHVIMYVLLFQIWRPGTAVYMTFNVIFFHKLNNSLFFHKLKLSNLSGSFPNSEQKVSQAILKLDIWTNMFFWMQIVKNPVFSASYIWDWSHFGTHSVKQFSWHSNHIN